MLPNKVESLHEQFVTLSLPIQPVTGQNGTVKILAVSIDLNSIELNIYLVATSYK